MSQQIYLVSDHAGFELKKQILEYLNSSEFLNCTITDLVPIFLKNDDYPDKARVLALAMENNDSAFGIAICGSGVGINIALNRYRHIRAVMGDKLESVKLSRLDNDTNVLSLGQRVLEPKKAFKLVKIFLETKFNSEERHLRRIQKIS
jgi:ribose 5-phosphate isomerase B